ncbi:pilin glycosylation ligase domain-containing protein [Enterobacter bugandensis]|uniref:pilin glycosylation ligase domain-containing protein n=1 Tax=Enterobacter bugandensis TaxID=881260 RepID=UPI0039C87414
MLSSPKFGQPNELASFVATGLMCLLYLILYPVSGDWSECNPTLLRQLLLAAALVILVLKLIVVQSRAA